MATSIPSTMRALAIATYCKPDEYDIATLPTPSVRKPTELLIRAHAASINPIDVKMASGLAKMMHKDTFPYKIGYDVAGTVAAVGSGVTAFKVGDEVYSRVPLEHRGAVADYVLSTEDATARKPEKLSWAEAASVPLAGLTALQSLRKADEILPGGLKGKTVFVPAGLSGTGSFAVQLAKNVFGAKEVLTTLSTGKIAQAKELLGADTFTAIDYTKVNAAKEVGKGKIDFLFDTMAATISMLGCVKKGGAIVSISTLPSGTLMKEHMGMHDMPTVVKVLLDLVNWLLTWWVSRSGINYSYLFMEPSKNDLEKFSAWIGDGEVKPIVGRTAKFSDIKAVREGCQQVFDGRGGVGKFVIEFA